MGPAGNDNPGTESHGESRGAERRRAVRISERLQVAYRALRGEESARKTHAAETLNLSASGLCLATGERLERESNLALEIRLEGHDKLVVAMGRVVWCEPDDKAGGGGRFLVGICFTWLREEDRTPLGVIADYVQARVSDGGADGGA